MTQPNARPRLSSGYWRLWWAGAISTVGDGVLVAAVPLLAITITDDPRLVSAVSAAAYLPWLLLSLHTGVLVDRHDRVNLMWRAQVVQALVVSLIAGLAAVGHLGIPLLALLVFALGAGEVVVRNAAQAIVPDLVPVPLLPKANGYQQTATTIGQQFVGAPIGGLLMAVAVAAPFGLDAVTFLVSAALLATLPRRGRPQLERPPMRTAIADGVFWLVRHRLFRTLAMLGAVHNFCYQLGNVTLVLLATQTLHLDGRGYGLLLAAAAVGSVLCGLVNARIINRLGALRALVTALAASIVVSFGIGLSPNATLLGLLLAVGGFVTTMWNIVTVSLRQELIPSGLLGRVNSIYRMLGWGSMPLGALVGGFIAHEFGLRAPYPVAGVLRGIALVAALPVLIGCLRCVRAVAGNRQ
jgi:MFS family permease